MQTQDFKKGVGYIMTLIFKVKYIVKPHPSLKSAALATFAIEAMVQKCLSVRESFRMKFILAITLLS